MSDVEHFALLVLVVGAAIIAAVLLNRISERIRIPAPAILLVTAAVASDVIPALGELSVTTVQRIVSVALAVILFDGGMHIGWQRFRAAAGPVVWVGVAGTFVTAAALAILAHVLFGLDWRASLLVGTALAPTDPAVVFSVLGRREVAGRSGTILEGEAGANDPVGIALLASLLAAGPALGLDAVGGIAGEFLLQLAVGGVVGVAGGGLLVRFMRRVPLPSEGLYPLGVLAGAWSSTGRRPSPTAQDSWPCSSPGFWLGTSAPLTRERSNGSTPPWPAWPRSWPSWCLASPWVCTPSLTLAGCGSALAWRCC
jgi:potassium/hydrogen antiporter